MYRSVLLPLFLVAAVPTMVTAQERVWQLPIRIVTIDGVWRTGDLTSFHEASSACVVAIDEIVPRDSPDFAESLANCVRNRMDLAHKLWLRIEPITAAPAKP